MDVHGGAFLILIQPPRDTIDIKWSDAVVGIFDGEHREVIALLCVANELMYGSSHALYQLLGRAWILHGGLENCLHAVIVK